MVMLMLMVMSTASKKVVFPRHGDSRHTWRAAMAGGGGKKKEPKRKDRDRDTLVKRGRRECKLCVIVSWYWIEAAK